jgi:hypothetical protein
LTVLFLFLFLFLFLDSHQESLFSLHLQFLDRGAKKLSKRTAAPVCQRRAVSLRAQLDWINGQLIRVAASGASTPYCMYDSSAQEGMTQVIIVLAWLSANCPAPICSAVQPLPFFFCDLRCGVMCCQDAVSGPFGGQSLSFWDGISVSRSREGQWWGAGGGRRGWEGKSQ